MITDLAGWVYWEGEMPSLISLCIQSIVLYNSKIRIIDRQQFLDLFRQDTDIDLNKLSTTERADFIRVFLLRHYGGIWIDADCICLKTLSMFSGLARKYGFAGYIGADNLVSCNLMAAEPAHPLVVDYYDRVCNVLRSTEPRNWDAICQKPLNEAIRNYEYPLMHIEGRMITPIPWTESQLLYIKRPDEEHSKYVEEAAYCYMLSHSTIKESELGNSILQMTQSEILNSNTFIAFLIRKALLNQSADPTWHGLVDK